MKKFLVVFLCVFFVLAVLGLGMSLSQCASLKIPADSVPTIAIPVACTTLAQDACFGAALDAVGVHQGTCKADIEAALEGSVAFDISKLSGLGPVCKADFREVKKYIDALIEKIPK